jgi:hypothetical protein
MMHHGNNRRFAKASYDETKCVYDSMLEEPLPQVQNDKCVKVKV